MLSILRSSRSTFWPIAFLLVIVSRLLFPGDVSFVNDEAKFLKIALEASKNGEFFSLGIEGAKGVKYGPLAIYWFRFLLFFGKQIYLVSLLNIVLLLSFSLFGISQVSKIMKEDFLKLSVLALSSPFLFFYGRNLWDNSLNQVLVVWAFVFFLRFIKERKVLDLLGLTLLCNGMFHIHPMSISISLSLLGYLLMTNISWFKKYWLFTTSILFLNLAIAFPYLQYFFEALLSSNKEPLRRPLRSFTNSFFVAQMFTTFKYSYFIGKNWEFFSGNTFGYFTKFLGFITWLGFLASWRSIILTIKGWSKESNLFLKISVIAVFTQAIYYCVFKIYGHPHYLAMNWIFALGLIYYSMNKYEWFFKVYSTALICSLYIIIFSIHYNGGSRSLHYGPTLSNQIKVADKMAKWNVLDLNSEAFHPKEFPHVLEFLRDTSTTKSILLKHTKANIKYTHPERAYNGSISIYKDFDTKPE